MLGKFPVGLFVSICINLCAYAWNVDDNPRCQTVPQNHQPSFPLFHIVSLALLAGPFPGSCTGRISHMPIISLAATGIQGGLPALRQRRRGLLRPQLLPVAELRHGATQGRHPGGVLRVQAEAVAAHLFHGLRATARHSCKRSYLCHD